MPDDLSRPISPGEPGTYEEYHISYQTPLGPGRFLSTRDPLAATQDFQALQDKDAGWGAGGGTLRLEQRTVVVGPWRVVREAEVGIAEQPDERTDDA